MKKRWTISIVLTLALLLSSGWALNAYAADSDTVASPTSLVRQGLMAGQQRAQTLLKAVAELTGLSMDDIRAQRIEGQSLAAIAEARGVKEQAVIDRTVAERTTALKQLKTEGKITEEQYQFCISNMQERLKANLERAATGPANNKAAQGAGRRQGAGQGKGNAQGQAMSRGMGLNQANCPYYTSN